MSHSHGLKVYETRDRNELRALLAVDSVTTAYLLGDLADPFFGHSRWLIAAYRERPEGVVLVYTGLSTPVVLSYGAPDAVSAIFTAHPEILAAPCYAKIPLEHEQAYTQHARVEARERLWAMGLTADKFQRTPSSVNVERLMSSTSAAELETLFRDYPGSFFEHSQLESGLYYGARSSGALIAVAGTHVFAPKEGVAVLGNIVTAKRERGRGLGQACTSALVSALFERGCCIVALQVGEENGPAIACYRNMGFSFRGVVLQSRCVPS